MQWNRSCEAVSQGRESALTNDVLHGRERFFQGVFESRRVPVGIHAQPGDRVATVGDSDQRGERVGVSVESLRIDDQSRHPLLQLAQGGRLRAFIDLLRNSSGVFSFCAHRRSNAGNVRVPLHQRRARAKALNGMRVQAPYRRRSPARCACRRDSVPMSVKPARCICADARRRDSIEIAHRIEAVVVGTHVHVVHIQQDAAVCLLGDGGKELPLCKDRVSELHVGGRVFQQDAPPEPILHLAHTAHHVSQGFLGVGQRQQIVEATAVNSGPAQMVGHQCRLDALHQRAQVAQVALAQLVGRADRERHAVQGDRIVAPNALQDMQRPAAAIDVVFGDGLEPVDAARAVAENVLVVLRAQSDTEAEARPGESSSSNRVISRWDHWSHRVISSMTR